MARLSSTMSLSVCVALALGVSATPGLGAGLTLTPVGIADGFNLTTFVSGYNGTYGPLSQGIAPNGRVITGSALDQRIYVFNDVDGQTLGSAVSFTPYLCETGNCNYAMTTAGGQVYGAQAFGGVYYQFDGTGARTPIPNLQALGLFGSLGMWTDPTNNHIIAASNQGLVSIDPVLGSFTVINAGLFPDGVSVSPDGATIFVENGGTIQSYDKATGALIHTYFTGHSPDGTGVIIGGVFNGDIIVNNNDGTLGLLDPSKADGDPNQFVIIADGGTRGDFTSADTSNGTLFISQNEQVLRLSCGPDCSIGSTGTPEPASYGLLGGGIAGLLLMLKRRKAAR